MYITTKMNFGNQKHMATFPRQITEWQGWDYDTADAKAQLGADIIVLRGYGSQRSETSKFIPG